MIGMISIRMKRIWDPIAGRTENRVRRIAGEVQPVDHTPLMSGSNAISGITIVGALLLAGALTTDPEYSALGKILGMVAVMFAMINVVGGFLVTHRMLGMFRKKK